MSASSGIPGKITRGKGSSFVRLVRLVAGRDYRRTVTRRGYIFGTLLMPLGLGLLMGVSSFVSLEGGGAPPDPPSVALLVVNESGVPLTNDPPIVASLEVVDRETALTLLRGGRATEAYLVPQGFPGSRTITRLYSPGAERFLDSLARHGAQQTLLSALLQRGVLLAAGLSPQDAAEATRPIEVVAMTVGGEPVSEASIAASFLVPLVFTLLFVMSIFITSGYLLQSVTEEKENRVVEIVLSSIPALPFMAGKIVGLGAAGLTQVAVWLAAGAVTLPLITEQLGIAGEISLPPAVIALAVAYFLLGYLAFGAIFAAIGALAPGNREAQQYSSFFGFFAVVPLVLSASLTTDPGSMVAWALALIPLTAPATMLQVITASGELPWLMVAASLLSLSLFVILSTILSARVFRATLLLYGVRPTLRQLLDALGGRA